MADYYGVDSLGNIIDESLYDDIPVEGFTDPSKRFVDMTDDEKIEYVAPLLKQHQMYNNVQYAPYRTFVDPRTGRLAVNPKTGEGVARRSTINTVDDGNQFYYNNYLRGSYIPEGYQQGVFPDGYPIPPGVSNQVRYSGADNPRQIDQYFRNAAGLDQPGITPNMTLNAPLEAHMDMRRIMGQPIFPVPPIQAYPQRQGGLLDIIANIKKSIFD